jgi:O-antigen ligase
MNRIFLLPAGLLMLAWLSPLHVLPWLSWQNEALAVLALLAGCASALYLRRTARPAQLLVPSLSALPLLLVGASVVQWVDGRVPYAGSVLTIALYAFVAAAAATAGHACGRSGEPETGLDALAWTVLAAALVQWVVACCQVFALWEETGWIARTGYLGRAAGNFAQPNHAALLFVMGLASAVYLLQQARLGKAVTAILLLLLATGLAMTQSRAGLLAVWVLSVFWACCHTQAAGRRGAVAAIGYALLAWGCFQAWPRVAAALWMQAPEAVNLTSSGRIGMWTQLLDAVQLRPWLGWGVAQVPAAQNAIANRFSEVLPATYSHSVLLDLALWFGLPVLILSLYLAVSWAIGRRRAVRGHAACYCAALALALVTQSLMEFPYAYAYFIVPVFFALGVFEAHSGLGRGLRITRAQASVALTAAGVLYAWALIECVQIEEDFRVARFEALRVGATPAAYAPPEIHLLTQMEALLRGTRVRPRPQMPAEEIELLRRNVMAYPWAAPNFNYALALALNGEMEEARRQMSVYRAMQGERSYERRREALDAMALEYPELNELRLPR